MQAQRQENKVKDGDSGEDESPVREKPQRPPNRRKKSREPLVEEDIVDGFAILGFKTYEDLEVSVTIVRTFFFVRHGTRCSYPTATVYARHPATRFSSAFRLSVKTLSRRPLLSHKRPTSTSFLHKMWHKQSDIVSFVQTSNAHSWLTKTTENMRTLRSFQNKLQAKEDEKNINRSIL